MSWVLGFGVLKACMQISIYKPYKVVGLPDKTTDHPLAHCWPGSATLDQGRSLRQPSRIMIGSIDHSQPAYFYTSQYDIWPAQHDSNVRPTP